MESVYSKRLFAKLEPLRDSGERIDFDKIVRAIQFAKKFHEGQMRSSGEPYYSHPIEVAFLVASYNCDSEVLVASILHDVVEDTEATLGMVLDNFGWRVAKIVYALTRDRDGGRYTAGEILQQMISAGDKDSALIKMMDRIHNLKTLEFQDRAKQEKTAKETIELFLAHAMDFGFDIERDLNVFASQVLFSQNGSFIEQLYSRRILKDDSFLIPSLSDRGDFGNEPNLA